MLIPDEMLATVRGGNDTPESNDPRRMPSVHEIANLMGSKMKIPKEDINSLMGPQNPF